MVQRDRRLYRESLPAGTACCNGRPDTPATPPVGNGGGSMPRHRTATMAEDERNPTHQAPAMDASAGYAGDALTEVAGVLAGALLRLHTGRLGASKKRGVSRDNLLGCPGETRPPAVNL